MAYFRPSLLPAGNLGGASNDALNQSIDLKEKSKEERPLTLFSVDLSQLSPAIQYIVLAFGLILFMCLYGYYQELVIYGWFDRKLSVFSTFLHFLGCFSFAQLQRNLSKPSKHGMGPTGCMSPRSAKSFVPVFSLGTAPPRVALFYYILLVLVRTGAQGMSNLSMTQINYPAKVLFKSASPIVTMIIGLLWFRKTYPLRDYIVVALLVLGLYIFITGDATASPQSTKLGIFYVTISLFGSAGIPMIQEHCMLTYNSSIEDLLYHTFLGSAIASLLASCVTGEFWQGVMFLLRTGSLHAWFIMFAFTVFGFIGTNFSAGLTLQYGALVNGITNTFRKALTLGLSFLLFPERNTVTHQKVLGSVIFFCGLLVRIFSKEGSKGHSKDSSANLLVYKDPESGEINLVDDHMSNNHSIGSPVRAHEIDVEVGVLRSERSIVAHNENPREPTLSVHTTYFGNNGSTDFGQTLSVDETLPLSNRSSTGKQYEPYFVGDEANTISTASGSSSSPTRGYRGSSSAPNSVSNAGYAQHSGGITYAQPSGSGAIGQHSGGIAYGQPNGGGSPNRLSGPGTARYGGYPVGLHTNAGGSASSGAGRGLHRVDSDHSLDGGAADHGREKIEALAV
jgi:hypothetical protein